MNPRNRVVIAVAGDSPSVGVRWWQFAKTATQLVQRDCRRRTLSHRTSDDRRRMYGVLEGYRLACFALGYDHRRPKSWRPVGSLKRAWFGPAHKWRGLGWRWCWLGLGELEAVPRHRHAERLMRPLEVVVRHPHIELRLRVFDRVEHFAVLFPLNSVKQLGLGERR